MKGNDLRNQLFQDFKRIRAMSLSICAPLEIEDYGIQSMPDASPPKWHLAHTTWFFETFCLARQKGKFQPFDSQYHYLFNSYYNSLGNYTRRSERGLLSRPTLQAILRYRASIDEQVLSFIESCADDVLAKAVTTIILGLQHEEQHQELLITDIKHAFYKNPTKPALIARRIESHVNAFLSVPLEWIAFENGLRQIGALDEDFSFDNERPRHPIFVKEFQIASRLVTNGEYLAFIEAKAYQNPNLWLSLGWEAIQKRRQQAPLYWQKIDGRWWIFTTSGMQPIELDEPVCHVSFYEAEAYARWQSARLPTEAEWEIAADSLPQNARLEDNNQSTKILRPLQAKKQIGLQQFFGDVWEWTASAYLPYPGFKPLHGPESEYNGKFMSNQMVLKGGSCATPRGHIRSSYRNFFPPDTRWQFSGIRLAKDL